MKHFLMLQKLRYDMGGWVTDIAQWGCILFLGLDRLIAIVDQTFSIDIKPRYALVFVLVAVALRWLAGYWFDKKKMMDAYQDVLNERNQAMKKINTL